MVRTYQPWSRYPRTDQRATRLAWRNLTIENSADQTCLPFGNGRSYGDVCLNKSGVVVDIRDLDHFIDFDANGGRVVCESGVLFSEILQLVVPRGWFLPVTPGTKFVTVGGAIANDVHGKNHHRAGTFGCHVERLEILRSDGSRVHCSSVENTDMFNATIGGLGLTGVILWAELRLKAIAGPHMTTDTIRFRNLTEFMDLSAESDRSHEYTVAWLDCFVSGQDRGRGVFMRANHEENAAGRDQKKPSRRTIPFPLTPSLPLINRVTAKVFNTIYYHARMARKMDQISDYDPFFYPLDAISDWNRVYGPKGFLQYQCVFPRDVGLGSLSEVLTRIEHSRQGSFLSVLKVFGDVPSPGLLSFPRPGITLALDFPFKGDTTLKLLDGLDEIVGDVGGAVYPAKDARMSSDSFKRYFPKFEEFISFIDPGLCSDFWRRVMRDC